MSEIKVEVKTFLTYYICKCCNVNRLVFKRILPDPTKCLLPAYSYEHECKNCERFYVLGSQYPILTYEEI